MLIWFVFAAMTGAAVLVVLLPLGRSHAPIFADSAGATALYRAQLNEIARDRGRGLLGDAEAEAARAEAGRRLLRATAPQAEPQGENEPSLRRRRAASAMALSLVPLLALLFYGAYGSPRLPDLPLAARQVNDPATSDLALALARIENHLAANPGDARGWSIVAPIYLRQGRFEDAARAFGASIRLEGASPDRLAGLGEAQILAAGGVVTAEARRNLAEAARLDPANARARYFLALAMEQDGDTAGAVTALKSLLADAPADAGWKPSVRARLDGLEAAGGTAGAIMTMSPEERQAAIRGMVASLAARLAAGGGSLEDWSRLVRSQMVLGDRDAAAASLATARSRLASDPAAPAALVELGNELGLKEPGR